jgi:hypothetical protein
MRDGIRQIIGKTITGLIVKERVNPETGPATQVFLLFSDGTNYELYGNVVGTSGLGKMDVLDIKRYMAPEMKVVLEAYGLKAIAEPVIDAENEKAALLADLMGALEYAVEAFGQGFHGDASSAVHEMKTKLETIAKGLLDEPIRQKLLKDVLAAHGARRGQRDAITCLHHAWMTLTSEAEKCVINPFAALKQRAR